MILAHLLEPRHGIGMGLVINQLMMLVAEQDKIDIPIALLCGQRGFPAWPIGAFGHDVGDLSQGDIGIIGISFSGQEALTHWEGTAIAQASCHYAPQRFRLSFSHLTITDVRTGTTMALMSHLPLIGRLLNGYHLLPFVAGCSISLGRTLFNRSRGPM